MSDAPADFTADSAVRRDGDRWCAGVTGSWSAPPGPNGGYIAALILGAIRGEVDDESRYPRALTVHYLRPTQVGAVEIGVTLERSGRSATVATARLRQEGKDLCIAVCTLAGEFEAAATYREPMPDVPPPAAVEPLPQANLPATIFSQLDFRMTFGDLPFTGSDSTLVGGWTRTRVPALLGPELLALYADAWWPTPFAVTDRPIMAPTLDLTIHFRAIPDPDPEQMVLARFSSTTAAEGYFEETGDLWSQDGVLLAQSRQLALARPLPPGFGE